MPGRWRRRPRPVRIDPFGVGEPWRHFVREALQAQARYRHAVAGVAAGPLRERLDDVGRRIDEATRECWRVALQGEALADTASTLEEGSAKKRLTTMVADAQEHLGRVEAGLDQAVAGAVELSARLAASTDAIGLGDDVEHLVDELASLRFALGEVAKPNP